MALELTLTLSPVLDAARLNVMINALKQSLGPLGNDIKPIDADALNAELKKVQQDAAKAAAEVAKMEDAAKKAAAGGSAMGKAFQFNQITQSINTVAQSFSQIIAVGNEYEATLAAVGAVTGQSGEGLEKLGTAARELSTQFGTSASSNLKSFQGILSKFGPQVADNAEALKSMGETVNTLSAASGDAADVSMAALTDTMLQLGLVSGDAAKDADTMRQVADALASSAKVGAAEIPQVAQSILQAGVAAKGAKLSLEQTTAAIQVLAVGGKTGSEAGIALRNVLGLLQKQSGPGAAALRDMGLSVEELGETLTTEGLEATLTKLKGGLDNAGTAAQKNAILMTLFGTENSAAAGILLDNLGQFSSFTEGISNAVKAGASGADGAVAQAQARLGTAEAIAGRVKAFVEDAFISIQSGFGSAFSGFLAATTQVAPALASLSGIKQLIPEGAAGKVLEWGKAIVSKLVPGLFAQAAATGGATTAQAGLNAAMLASPAGIILGSIAALVVGTKLLADALHETAAERLEEQKATTAVLEEQRKVVASRYEQVKAQSGAAASYRGLIEAQQEATKNAAQEGQTKEQAAARAAALENANKNLRDATVDLAGAYPGIIDGTKTTEENLAALEAQSQKNASEMIRLAGEMNKLDKQLSQARAIELQLEVAVAGEELEDALTDALDISFGDQIDMVRKGDFTGALKSVFTEGLGGFGTEISEFLLGTSEARSAGEDLVAKFKNDVFNAKSADEISKAQAQMISKIALDAKKLGIDPKDQQKIIASIKGMGEARIKQLEEQKKAEENLSLQTADTIAQAFSDATASGKDTTSTINELSKAFGLSAEKVRSIALDGELKKANADAKITQKEVDDIAGKFGLSKDEAKKLLDEQLKQTQEAKNTAASVGDITKAYNESFAAVKAQREDGIAQEIALDAKIRSLKKNDPERKRLEGELAAIRQRNREADREFDREEARQKRVKEQYDEKEKKQKSLFQELKREFDLKSDVLEAEQQRSEIAKADEITAEGRKKSALDEVILQLRAVEVMEKKLEAAKSIGLIDETGNISVKITGDERAEAEKMINGLNLALLKEQSKLKEIKLKATLEGIELEEALREAKLDELRAKVEEGIVPSSDLVDALKVELARVGEAYETADAKTKLELLKKQQGFQKEIDKLNKDAYSAKIKALEDAAKAEDEAEQEAVDRQRRNADALISSASSVAELAASKTRDERLANLDKLREDEAISEAAYNLQRETAEAEFQARLTAIKAREAGQRRALEDAQAAADLQTQRDRLRAKLEEATAFGQTSDAEKFQEELTKVEDTLAEKSDTIGSALGIMKDGLDSTLGSLFEGNTEAMKENMRSTLATIAGFIEKLASAAIIELVLGSAPLKTLAATFGFLAPVILGGFTQLIGSGVRALINPILSSITSFATGAKFTGPTLALVGDASRLGGSNTEYLLRDNQLQAVITAALTRNDDRVVQAIMWLGERIFGLERTFVLRGEDLHVATKRASSSQRRRSRTLPPLKTAA